MNDDAFVVDGSLRDIVIRNTSGSDRQRLLDALRERRSRRQLSIRAEPPDLPTRIDDILKLRARASPLLVIDYRGLSIHCHFFVEDEIEFDIDPREASDEHSQASVREFMRMMADAVGLPVALTSENSHDSSFLEYDPRTGRWTAAEQATDE